jgi:arginyl-tRNA synthetase
MHEISAEVQKVVKDLFNEELNIELSRTDEQFGDYATNVALRFAKKVGKNPHEIAEAIFEKLQASEQFEKVEVAGPGFINLTLTDESLQKLANAEPTKTLEGKTVVAEYSDPNPFKVLHAGHLYTSVVGDAIANLLEHAGAIVHRVNFGGDVGLHVAKAMWGILHKLSGAEEDTLSKIDTSQRADWLAEAYVEGNIAYEQEVTLKGESGYAPLQGDMPKLDILLLNTIIYDYWGKKKFANESHQFRTALKSDELIPISKIYRLYEIGREWSYNYFNEFYARIGTKFEKYYPESETADLGLEIVKEHVGDVYEESYGAIVFNGEKHGLHTRVFINSEGLPTYEAKDVGLALKKWEEYHFDISVIITGNDIVEYMKVVLKSLEQFQPEIPARTKHLTHGQVKLAGGIKMSSRRGNILRAVDVLDAAASANKESSGKEDEVVSLGAVKYAFLKQRVGGDIIYDPKESVSLQGNSGPYLQYAHARACSILAKTNSNLESGNLNLEVGERSLLRKISEYAEVVERATVELMPHHICTYLYELAQVFNRFYEGNRVVGDEREALRIQLVKQYAHTLKAGLELLGIRAPEKM